MEIEITKISANLDTVDLRPIINFANLLNNILTNVRMCHWYTTNFNVHNITGDLYNSLNLLADQLQEEIIGSVKSSNILFPLFNTSEGVSDFSDEEDCNIKEHGEVERVIFYIKLLTTILTSLPFQHYIEDCGPNGIKNTVDEIISQINKFLYLNDMINS